MPGGAAPQVPLPRAPHTIEFRAHRPRRGLLIATACGVAVLVAVALAVLTHLTRTSAPADPCAGGCNPVQSWYYHEGGQSLLGAVDAVGPQFAADKAGGDSMDAMETACVNLHSAAQNARTATPVPDPGIQSEWAEALDRYNTGAIACLGGIRQDNTNFMHAARDDIRQGNSFLSRTNADIQAAISSSNPR
jgi:putative intracellular protease/amidase